MGARGTDDDPRAHRVANENVVVKLERGGKPGKVGSQRIETIIEMRAGLRQAAPPNVEHVGVEAAAKAFGDEAPGDGRARYTRHEHQRRPGAAISQVVLPDVVGADVRAVQVRAPHQTRARRAARYVRP